MKPYTAGMVIGAVYKAKICDHYSIVQLATHAALHSTNHFGDLASLPIASYILLPCAYDIYYDYAVLLWLVSYYIHALINATCAGTRLYR